MELRRDTRYDLITVSSMGVRITPMDRQSVHTSNIFKMQSTSAETNVLNVSAALGLNTMVMTRFVENNAIANFIKAELRKRNIKFIGKDIPQGGPWGYRHQFNIADSGYGLRGPIVTNDRAGEVGRTICAEDINFEQIFKRDGCHMLHLSGLIAALSQETSCCCLKVAEYAKANGTLVSFDLNYRASFWNGREEEYYATFKEIASLADILVGNEEDFQLCLGIKGPEAGGKDIAAKIEGFKGMIFEVEKQYPNAKYFATTLRQVIDANEHLWGAILHHGDEWYVEEPRQIPVLDRIGGGDGFTGGLLYGIFNGWEAEKCMQFGWATGALAATSLNDYATPADEEQVWSIYAGNARVKR